jgi:hypothetical protein
MKRLFVTLLCFLTTALASCRGSDPDLAKDLAEEGVVNEAKIELIKVLHDPSKKSSYDLAEYYLGYLDFKEQNYELALKHWTELQKKWPTSPYAQKAKDQTQLAYQLLARQQKFATQDLETGTLFENADFLVEEPLKVRIDTSYLSNGDLAIQCLEEILARYPRTPQAARALFREALVYYGWGKEGIGEYSRASGYGFTFYQYYSHDKKQADSYIKLMEGVLARLQQDYPDSLYAIPIAYLIGQAYWARAGGQVDESARTYWKKVLTLAGEDRANLYRQLAESRLQPQQPPLQ